MLLYLGEREERLGSTLKVMVGRQGDGEEGKEEMGNRNRF